MEELHVAAAAYYNNATGDLQALAWNFFRSMDTDGNGRVSFAEFDGFFKQCGYNGVDTRFFVELDRNRDGSLDFWEVLTLYYIMKTRAVIWCNNCRSCLVGLYFTCLYYFDGLGDTYDLCPNCYRAGLFQHPHASLLDSYMLLRFKRGSRPIADTNLALVPAVAPNTHGMENWWTAFEALEMALGIANILTNCSIM